MIEIKHYPFYSRQSNVLWPQSALHRTVSTAFTLMQDHPRCKGSKFSYCFQKYSYTKISGQVQAIFRMILTKQVFEQNLIAFDKNDSKN